MKNVILKNGTEICLKTSTKEDAQSIIDFYNFIGGETDFLSFGENEFPRGLKEEENSIDNSNNEVNSIMLLAIVGKEIAGIITINSSQKPRIKHTGVLGIGIKKSFCGLGLGNILMDEVIEWAKNNGITKKITLITRVDNLNAIKLYENKGFKVEGIFEKDNLVKDIYYDSLYMSLML